MKKIIIATVVSLGLGFGACYAYLNKTITNQAETIATLTKEVDSLNSSVDLKESEYQEAYADKQRYQNERNAAVLFGMQLCKKMKDSRSCLMELAIKTNSTVDFK
ncbi:hypothetical protein ABIV32_001532 [Salmonella enterica subsp. enterica]